MAQLVGTVVDRAVSEVAGPDAIPPSADCSASSAIRASPSAQSTDDAQRLLPRLP
jgi:hypothetical protein